MLCVLTNNHPVIEFDKLHQAGLAQSGLYGGLQLGGSCRSLRCLPELCLIRVADCRLKSSNDFVERLRGDECEPFQLPAG
jgi:hypothetical protein